MRPLRGYNTGMSFAVEIEQEADGRWIAEVPDLSGVMVYGKSRDEALSRVQALALRGEVPYARPFGQLTPHLANGDPEFRTSSGSSSLSLCRS